MRFVGAMEKDNFESEELSPIAAENKFRRAVQSQSRLVNFLAILAGPTALAVWLGVFDAAKVGAVWFWVITILIVAFQAVLYLVNTQYSETVPALHLSNSVLSEAYEEAIYELKTFSQERKWLQTANRLGSYWSTFQGLIDEKAPSSESDFSESCGLAVKPMIDASGILFGFEFDDIWSVTVYGYDRDSDRLIPVWFKRTEDHPSTGAPRAWKQGDGHVGSAFMQNRILYTVDMADGDASMLLQPSAENGREYDENVYRSFVSAPITLDLKSGPAQFGVLVVTSNVIGRFNEENRGIVGHAAQVLAHLFDWRSRLQPESK